MTEQPGRPLGRGLEEISHLFLSQSNAVRVRAPQGPRAARLGIPVLRAGEPISKAQLTTTLREYPGALDDGLTIVASGVPCNGHGDIDLIATGRDHQAIVIDVDTEPNMDLFLRGLSHVDWIGRNLSTVQSLRPEWTIDTTQRPGLFLVAPRFPSGLRGALRQISQPEIVCFTCRFLAVDGGTGVFLERLGDAD